MDFIYSDIWGPLLVTLIENNTPTDMPYIHYHDAHEIYILDKGNRDYLIEDIMVNISEHDVVLVKPYEMHTTMGGGYKRILICFRESYLKRFFTDEAINKMLECFEKRKVHINITRYERLYNLAMQLMDDYDDFYAFLEIIKILNDSVNDNTEEIDIKDNMLISNIIKYIGENFTTINSLEDITEKFYITKFYLCRLFKKYTAVSVISYINARKVTLACELLTDTNLTVEEIATRCGFNSSMYFCRIFKSIKGISPLQYRKQ